MLARERCERDYALVYADPGDGGSLTALALLALAWWLEEFQM